MFRKTLLITISLLSFTMPCFAMTIIVDKQFGYIPEQSSSISIDDNKNVYIKVDASPLDGWVLSLDDIVNPLNH